MFTETSFGEETTYIAITYLFFVLVGHSFTAGNVVINRAPNKFINFHNNVITTFQKAREPI